MGMVRAVQSGRMPLSKASPRVRHVATSMDPKDVSEFAATKHKDLPEHVADSADTKSAQFRVRAAFSLVKQADVTAALNKARMAVRRVGDGRRRLLETETKALRQKNQKLEQDLQKAQMSQSSQQAAMAAQPPVPPSAQAPYGAMLLPGADQAQAANQAPKGKVPGKL